MSFHECCILSFRWQVTEVFLIAFGEIAGGGEAKLEGYLLYRHVCGMEKLVRADEPALPDIVKRPLAGHGLDTAEELGAAQLKHRPQILYAQILIRQMIIHRLFQPLGKRFIPIAELDCLLHILQLRQDLLFDFLLEFDLIGNNIARSE